MTWLFVHTTHFVTASNHRSIANGRFRRVRSTARDGYGRRWASSANDVVWSKSGVVLLGRESPRRYTFIPRRGSLITFWELT